MFRRFFLSLVLLFAGFAAGLAVTARIRAADACADLAPARPATTAVEPQRPAPTPAQTPSASYSGVPDFTRVAASAVKGVSNISSLQVVRAPNSPFSSDPFFRYFFGDDDIFGSRDRRSMSLGSGVIISSDGYIVTNNHVIGENENVRGTRTEITIALPDKREVRGRIIGTDPTTDIALVKANLTGLPVIPWGDSSQLKIGEWVLAIGSPFQLSQTVTAGIVSATGRSNLGFTDYEDFIQTDAAINPGNSGGALVNTRGELVGIHTGIFSQRGGYQGIGFAVPSNLARHMVDDLMKYGEVHRGTIGGIVTIDHLTSQAAEELGLNSTSGAVITRMQRASAAYDVGIRPGDVIVRFNNTAIEDPSQLYRLVADARVGSDAAIRVLRSGRPLDFKVPIVSDSRGRR